jgi:hypothetical protein
MPRAINTVGQAQITIAKERPSMPPKPKEPLILITLNPARVVDVTFVAQHVLDQQLLFEVWPQIKPHLDRIDHKLRKLMGAVADELERKERLRQPQPIARGKPLEGEYEDISCAID